MKSFKAIALAGLAAIAAASSSVAGAGVIELDTFVTGSGYGGTPPTGKVTITDIGDEVRVDFEISDGDISALYFNLVNPFDFDDLLLSSVSTLPDNRAASLVDSPSAPSGLDFDFGVDFGTGTSPGNLVRSGSFVLALDSFDLSQPSFYEQSTNSAGLSVTAGVRVQSLGPGNAGSATIGGNPGGSTGSTGSTGGTPVPAPAGLMLIAPALGALAVRRRRRKA